MKYIMPCPYVQGTLPSMSCEAGRRMCHEHPYVTVAASTPPVQLFTNRLHHPLSPSFPSEMFPISPDLAGSDSKVTRSRGSAEEG